MSQKTIKFLSIDLIDIREKLNNLSEIYNFIDELLLQSNLKEIHKPVLVPYYHGKVKEDSGVSCYAFFEGGYCTFHIFEKRRIAYFDIMSDGKTFSKQSIIEVVSKYCATKNILINSDDRLSDKLNRQVFGPHYICFGKPKIVFDTDTLTSLQGSIIKNIGMTPITIPALLKTKTSSLLFILIAESHIAIKLTKNCLQIDIFSCKMFDLDKLKKILSQYIEIKDETLYYRLYKI